MLNTANQGKLCTEYVILVYILQASSETETSALQINLHKETAWKSNQDGLLSLALFLLEGMAVDALRFYN